jgi:trigger factor
VIGDLTTVEIETVKAAVSEVEIDKTIDILRKQRVHFHTKGEAGEHGDGGEAIAANGDRVTVDFVGSIDGVEFPAVSGRLRFRTGRRPHAARIRSRHRRPESGRSQDLPLAFPEDYHGKDVAGKTAPPSP